MLEKAIETTREGKYTHIAYARFADDLVILVDFHRRWDWLFEGVQRRLGEELVQLGVAIHEEKTKVVDLRQGEKFGFLGFDFRRNVNAAGKGWLYYQPQMAKCAELLRKLKAIIKRHISHPIGRVIDLVKDWVEKKLRRFNDACKEAKRGWLEEME